MSLEIVKRAAQVLVAHTAQASQASSPSLFETDLHQFKGFSPSYGLFGITSSDSLVNRTVVLMTIGLGLANCILHTRAHVPGSADRKNCQTSFMRHSLIITVAWMYGLNSVIACYGLRALVQFKNACTVLPYLNEQSSQSTTISRIGRVAYSAIKYVAMIAVAVAAFKATRANLLNGAWFFGLALLPFAVTDMTIPRNISFEDDSKQTRLLLGQQMGDHVASGLFLTMVGMGVGAAVMWRGGLSSIERIGDRNPYDFLRVITIITFGASIVSPVKRKWHQFQLLDDHSFPFIKYFSHACTVANTFHNSLKIKITKSHLNHAYQLALAYSAKQNYPEQRQEILAALRRVPEDKRAFCFVQNLPFLDEQDLQEFIQTYPIQLLDFWNFLSPTQIQRFLIPQDIVLSEAGLTSLQVEIDSFEHEIKAVIQKYAITAEEESLLTDKDKAEREFKIYEEIQSKHQKLMNDSASIASLVYTIGRMEPQKATSQETRDYVQFLKTLSPKLDALQAKMVEVENTIEECTGELTQTFEVAIGAKGVRADGCNQIFKALGRPPSEHPFIELTQVFAMRGIKTKFDLIQKGILVHSDDEKQCRERLIDFLLN